MVVGEFKRGKSSLLDALLDEDPEARPPVLPVDVDIATNLVTQVSWGPEERISVVVDGPDGSIEERTITRAEIADYATEPGNPDNERGARLMLAQLTHPKLADGLVLIDTPGVGSLNRRHTATTYGFITKADAVVFVLDAKEPLSTEALDFLRTIRDHTRAILFAVTKTDVNADHQTIVENTRMKAADALECAPEDIVVVGVSSFAKFEYLRTGDPEDLEVSNFDELERALWRMRSGRGGRMQLLRCAGETLRQLDRVLDPLTVEYEALRSESAERIAASERAIEAKRARFEELRGSEADWRKSLRRRIDDVKRDLRGEFRGGRRTLLVDFDRYTRDPRMLEEPEEVAGAVERDLTLLAGRVSERVAEEAAEILRELATRPGSS